MFYEDDLDRWEDQVAEEYEEYLESVSSDEDKCVMSFMEFRNDRLDEACDRYEGMDEQDMAEAYA